MNPQQEIIHLIATELAKSRSKNSTYSLRALAKKLAISPSVLSETLNGRRPITKKTGQRLLAFLKLPPDKYEELISTLPARYTKNVLKNMPWSIYSSRKALETAQFDLVADWHYFGILSLAETKTFRNDMHWIARRLNINVTEAKKAVTTLVQMQLLKQDTDGHLKPTGKQFTTTTDISNAAVRKHHLQHLDILRKSLTHDPVEVRDFLTMTLTFDPACIAEAKSMIDDFQNRFTKKMEKKTKKEVYRLSIQLVPLTKEVSK